MYPLATTHSAESPTAWASFATGVNPGKHNIYDFLVRDTATYLPDLGMVHREPARFLFNYVPYAKPRLSSIRGGTSFWVTAGKGGRAIERAHGPGDVSAGRSAERRAAVRPAAAGHPRHDGDLLLLRDRPEPLRRRATPSSAASSNGSSSKTTSPARSSSARRTRSSGSRSRRSGRRRRSRSPTATARSSPSSRPGRTSAFR